MNRTKNRTYRVKRLFAFVVLKIRNIQDGLTQIHDVDPVSAQWLAHHPDMIVRHYTLPEYRWFAMLPSCQMKRADWELQFDVFKERAKLRQGFSLN